MKVSLPQYMVLRTSGKSQTFWLRFRHPLRDGDVVHRSTGIPLAKREDAQTLSNALAQLIQKKAGWGDRYAAIARNKTAADLYYTLALRPQDRPDSAVTIDHDLRVMYTTEPTEDDADAVPLSKVLQIRKKDRDALTRVNEQLDAALQREATKDFEIETLNASIQELEAKIISLTGEKEKAPPPMPELVKLYLAGLKGKKGKPVNPTHKRTRERHLAEFWPSKLGTTDIRKITMPVVDAVITKLCETLTSKTAHIHLESLKAFLWWAVKMDYVVKNPLEHMEGLDCMPTQKRSALTLAELQKLLKSAPPERKILYQIAVVTGYRKKELTALRVRDFDSEKCMLTLDGEHTKNKKVAVQLLPVQLANELAALVKGKKPDDALLDVPSHIDRYFKNDLGAVADGRVVVFHSLRHSTSTLLSAAGATVKEQTEIMRHSDPRLTINQYTDVELERLRLLAEALGRAVSA